MKNVFLFQNRTLLKSTTLYQFFLISSLFLLGSNQAELRAQQDPVLSIQGILKKANGEAVADGNYDITFKLYENAETGQPVWTEEQMDVEVISGIYSTVLGNSEPLDIPFDTIYYLGVTVGSTEMKPRIQLTSAPYALALIGESNRFPSSGLVKADHIEVKGSVLARAGIPGANGTNQSGYAFMANNGKKDSGLFSTPTSGNVSLYVANSEKLKATADSVVIKEDLRIAKGKNIKYDGLDDWRLVETDYFETDEEGWKRYNPSNAGNPLDGWKSTSGTPASVTTFSDDFAGKAIVNTAQAQVFKKKFTLPGSSVAGNYTYIKVVFNYYFLNTWDGGEPDLGWAAFSKTENCAELSVGWNSGNFSYTSAGHWLGNNVNQFGPSANFVNGDQGNSNAQWSDQWRTEEMIARYPSGPNNADVWVIFGHASNEGPGSENFAIGMVEIWVK